MVKAILLNKSKEGVKAILFKQSKEGAKAILLSESMEVVLFNQSNEGIKDIHRNKLNQDIFYRSKIQRRGLMYYTKQKK